MSEKVNYSMSFGRTNGKNSGKKTPDRLDITYPKGGIPVATLSKKKLDSNINTISKEDYIQEFEASYSARVQPKNSTTKKTRKTRKQLTDHVRAIDEQETYSYMFLKKNSKNNFLTASKLDNSKIPK